MTNPNPPMREHLRELERAFAAFERGDVNRLYESRESLLGLSESIEADGWYTLTPICEIASRLLGVVLMERGLTEVRAVQVVRELLEYVEGEVARGNAADGNVDPGGVFHIVNSKKVGELLMSKGLVNQEDLEKALVLQRVRKGRRVGEVLVAMNVIDQRTLDDVLEAQRQETRREETRRGTRGGEVKGATIKEPDQTAGSTAIPQLPGIEDPPAPLTTEGPPPTTLSLDRSSLDQGHGNNSHTDGDLGQ